ncbi:PEP-CTERM sorting domain-containing protein [Rariglobus hedericola]|uniref:PEP-CTERM sorting domain-containing protein n=1 Tax=Rariglobus hedericola TaxID=2597822 RepID=A0A556QPZ3_9BACT|nr:PEP-CTERM sorting domain-containing protein [Rariglobus hedericola]TSJ78710.1 PEP-CTERM sorting domain-containing protein [Rariglobus hedericola]
MLTLAAACAQAATFTWDGGGGDSNWETANNWNPNVAPGHSSSGDNFVFAGTTRLSNDANSGGWDIGSLTFNSTAGAFTLGGGTLTIGSGGVTNNSTSTQTINNQITLAANQTWTAASGAITSTGYFNANSKDLTLAGSKTITVTGQVNNVATLNLTGSGNRTFSSTNQVAATSVNVANTGTNTFNGQMNVGTLNASAGTSTFANVQASSGINVSGSANASFTGPVSGGTSGISISSSGNINFSGSINSGSLTLNGTGTTTLSGSGSKSTGAVVVNSGTLVLNQTGGGDAINNSLTVNSGGTVIFAGDNQVPEWQTVTLNTGSTLYLGDTTQTFASLVITGDSVIDFGSSGSQLNVTYGGISIASGITITIVNWDASAGDVFAGSNPGAPVVNVQYADSSGHVYASGTWSGGYVTPGAPVPEPATYGLIMLGAGIGFVVLRRRQREKQ